MQIFEKKNSKSKKSKICKNQNEAKSKFLSKKHDKQTKIIEAALKLLNEDNLNNLSLRKLAKLLNMQAPALYWYFESKSILIDYMAEAILKKEFDDLNICNISEPWQDWLKKTMNKLRKAMLKYNDGARVVAGAHLFPAKTLAKLIELSLRSLTEAGLDLMKAHNVVMTAITYTFGYTIEEQSSSPMENIKHDTLKDFPTLSAIVDEFNRGGISTEDDFNAGLRLIINKI